MPPSPFNPDDHALLTDIALRADTLDRCEICSQPVDGAESVEAATALALQLYDQKKLGLSISRGDIPEAMTKVVRSYPTAQCRAECKESK